MSDKKDKKKEDELKELGEAINEEDVLNSLGEKLAEKKKAQRKKTFKRGAIASVVLLFSLALWFLFKPFKASADYGICRTVLELFVPYPSTIYVSELAFAKDGAMKLWYTHTDAFGEFRMEPFECKVSYNERGQPFFERLRLNKIDVQEDKVADLNKSMAYFVANPLVLNVPIALSDSIGDLHLDIEGARRIQLDIKKSR